jgi:hypothetical protein
MVRRTFRCSFKSPYPVPQTLLSDPFGQTVLMYAQAAFGMAPDDASPLFLRSSHGGALQASTIEKFPDQVKMWLF